MAHLLLEKLWKRFGTTEAVAGITLAIERGEFVSLLGPSGCGKTTTLRLVAGLVNPDAGEIWLEGEQITQVPAYLRGMGMVFQALALFPNMTAAENIAFPLKVRGVPAERTAPLVREIISLVGLEGLENRYPHELSGGQQQRVGLGRALAGKPRVLLLDEPLTALDAPLRASLRTEIRRIQQRLRVTTLYVTHDQEEALSLSDRVVVMHRGRIEEVGRPQDLYRSPRSVFAATFIGSSTLLVGTIVDPGAGILAVGSLRLRCANLGGMDAGARARVLIRAEAVRVLPPVEPPPPDFTCLTGTLLVKSFRGPATLLEVDVQDTILRAETASEVADLVEAGKPVRLAIAPEACRIIEVLPSGEDGE